MAKKAITAATIPGNETAAEAKEKNFTPRGKDTYPRMIPAEKVKLKRELKDVVKIWQVKRPTKTEVCKKVEEILGRPQTYVAIARFKLEVGLKWTCRKEGSPPDRPAPATVKQAKQAKSVRQIKQEKPIVFKETKRLTLAGALKMAVNALVEVLPQVGMEVPEELRQYAEEVGTE